MPAIITGAEAIDYIKNNTTGGVTINKSEDPIEGERLNITADDAFEIAREDASLIYIEIDEAKTFTYWRDLTAHVADLMGPHGTPGDGEKMADYLDGAGFVVREDGAFVLLPTTERDWEDALTAVCADA